VGGKTGKTACTKEEDCDGEKCPICGGIVAEETYDASGVSQTKALKSSVNTTSGSSCKQCTCCMRPTFDYSMPIHEITDSSIPSGHGWCAFGTLANILGGDPCNWALAYCRMYNIKDGGQSDCNLHTGGISDDNQNTTTLQFFRACFNQYGAHFVGSQNVSNGSEDETCTLIKTIKPNKGVLIMENIGMAEGHVYLVYGFHRSGGGDVTNDAYDTASSDGRRYHSGTWYPITTPNYVISK
jgi:hypothetical protein